MQSYTGLKISIQFASSYKLIFFSKISYDVASYKIAIPSQPGYSPPVV